MNPQQYDELTGLEKRDSVLRKIKLLITENKKFHIIFADIDFFKSINDNFGHKRGDEILKEVSQFLKETISEDEIVSRWGGDEFLIVLRNNPLKFTEKISGLLTGKKFKGEPELCISLSFGIASFPEDGTSFENLYDVADKRMYDFKKKRRWKGRIIGRKSELSKIRKMIDSVLNGNSLIVNLYGDYGVGKTRLIQESSIYAQITGFETKIISGKKREEFFDFFGGKDMYNVEDVFMLRLKEYSIKKPLFLSIDDIDVFPEIQDMIKKSIYKTSKVFLITSSVKKIDNIKNIRIENLDIYETGELVESLVGSRNFKNEFVNFIFKETKGNPGKIIKIVKHFINLNDFEKIDFSEYNYIEEVKRNFYERFNENEKEILKVSTVLGENFDSNVVSELTSIEENIVLSVIEKAENSGLFVDEIKDILKEDARSYYVKIAEYFSKIKNRKVSGDFYCKAGMPKEAHIEYLKYLEDSFGKFLPEEYEGILSHIEEYKDEEWFLKKEFYLRKADYYYRIGKLRKSLEYFDKALKIEPDKEILLKKSKTLAKLGEMKEAYNTLNLIGDIALPFLSELFIKIGDIERAYINAKKAVEKLKEPEYLMEAYAALGGVNIKMREYDKGIKNLEKALLLANCIDNTHWISIINNRIAAIFFLKSNFTTAKVYYEKALQGFKSIGDIYSIINVYINLGLVFEKEGDIINALNLYKDAFELSKEFSFDYLEGEARYSIGRIYNIKGDFRNSIDYLKSAIEIMKRNKSLENLFELYYEISEIYLKLNETSDAEFFLKKAKKISEELKSERLKKKILTLESYYHILNGKPSVAIRILENFKNTQFQELKAKILIYLALAYDSIGDKKNARLYGTKALKYCKENCSILEICSCYDKLSDMKTFREESEKLKSISLNIKRRLKFDEI